MSDSRAKKDASTAMNTYIHALKKQMFEIKCEVLEGGKLPSKAHHTDAGFDVFATDDVVIKPGEIIKHPLNIRMHLPAGSWARIETKSGLGSKGMLVYAGVVDQEYRGIPHVIATNLNATGEAIEIKKGQKIAQITMNPHSLDYYMFQVESIDTATDRGTGGFGSSGV
jgi:dUTP pyrophosphatase